jgi:hypothetical protein
MYSSFNFFTLMVTISVLIPYHEMRTLTSKIFRIGKSLMNLLAFIFLFKQMMKLIER